MTTGTTDSQILADDLLWAESPCWRDGEIWVSDTQGSRLIIFGEQGRRVHELDTPVNGTGFLPSGELVGARMVGARLDCFDGSRWTLHADLASFVEGTLGDLIVLPDGSVLVDEVRGPDGPGRLLRVASDGPEPTVTVAAENLVFPNGLATVDGGTTLVVAETYAARLTAFTIEPDGELTNRRVWFDLKATLGEDFRPDGVCAAADGSLWVATTSGNSFIRVRDGAMVDRIDVGAFAIACCAGEGDELVLTTASSVAPELSVIEAAHAKCARASVSVVDHPINLDANRRAAT